MLETEECSGRIWTSNWNSAMIQNLSDILNLRKVSKKVLVSLRKTLLEMGGIFADGVREILDHCNTIHTASATAEQYLQDKIERGKLRRQLKLDKWLTEGRCEHKDDAIDPRHNINNNKEILTCYQKTTMTIAVH